MNYLYIIFANLTLVALSLIDNGRGPAYPDILSFFKIEASVGSWMFSLATAFSLLTYLTARFWLPRLRALNGARAGLVFLGLSSVMLALSGHTISLPLLFISSCVMGVGVGLSSATMNLLVIRGTLPEVRRKYLSGLHAVYGLSSLLAPLILSGLLMMGFSWITFFWFTAGVCFAVLAASLSSKGAGSDKEDNSATLKKGPLVAKLLVCSMMGLYVSSEIALSSRLPLYLKLNYGMSIEMAGNYLSAFFFFLMCGRLLFALKHFPISNFKLMTGSLVSSLILFFLGHFVDPLFYPLIGFANGPFFPTAIDTISKRYKESSDDMITWTFAAIGMIMTVMHIGFGQITTHYGVETAFLLIPFLAILSLISLGILVLKK
ncbi:MAG: MFS transporter [Bacteriovoracaceae bacterium]|nr:MFS transporter [Bacteriovoracaceae bacterium]